VVLELPRGSLEALEAPRFGQEKARLFQGQKPMSIQSFGDKETEQFFYHGKLSRKCSWATQAKTAQRKLDMIHAAAQVEDLRYPPGNHLELLGGDRKGFYSIRINDQWRIVFIWALEGAYEVSVVDYH
jgi:proteic killer suppression protein